MNALELALAKKFKAKHCLYTHSGTTALYLCFLYAKKQGKNKILMPSIICPQVFIAALKAGLKIFVCDVKLSDYTLSFKALKRHFRTHHFDILLLAHVYGHFCDKKIIDFCKNNNIFIIEDSAQTYRINQESNFSILSFGHTKFLQNAYGGGVYT